MIVATRQCEPEQQTWSSKLEAIYSKPPNQRMSSYDSSVPAQQDWQGQYSFLPHGEHSVFGQSFEASPAGSSEDPRQKPGAAEGKSAERGGLTSPIARQADSEAAAYDTESEGRGSATGLSVKPDPEGPVADPRRPYHMPSMMGGEDTIVEKEEEEDMLDDEDDMLEGEGEHSGTMTAAERSAARRKMKRFRLTHQQTRFLMSEFAKQPHPDAAHRERLSREIPGLSPRQVQVWFQNRRAKIKRLNADDRDRVMKMRAVPDDFDNVQALHSPYGAVHGLGPPMTPPVDFNSHPGHSYGGAAEHMMRPLIVDTIRRGGEEQQHHISPTGLTPSFGNMGFSPSGSELMSPMNPSPNDPRGNFYSSQMSSPLGPRTSNPYAPRHGLDTGDAQRQQQQQQQQQQQMRPLQPLQLRETLTRSRSESLQSPLRSSMSWKGDAIDYAGYSGAGSSPSAARNPSAYHPEQSMGGGAMGYDSGSYSTSSRVSSPPKNINYSTVQPPPTSAAGHSKSRMRAASASLPLALDLRNQYRPTGDHQQQHQHPHHQPHHGAPPSTAPLQPLHPHQQPRSSSANPYTTNYPPSAPLTAPVEYSLPKTPGLGVQQQEYHATQLGSAPISQPPDFARALQHQQSGVGATRTPMRDSFGGGGGPLDLSGQPHTPGTPTPGGDGRGSGGDYFGQQQQVASASVSASSSPRQHQHMQQQQHHLHPGLSSSSGRTPP